MIVGLDRSIAFAAHVYGKFSLLLMMLLSTVKTQVGFRNALYAASDGGHEKVAELR